MLSYAISKIPSLHSTNKIILLLLKISALGKLHDLSGLLGHCLRQGKMDIKHVIAIIDTLKFFIITQSTRLENAYVLEYQQAVRARAAFTGINGPKSLKESKISNLNVSSNNNIPIKKNDNDTKNTNTETKTSISNSNNSNTTAKRPRDVEQKAPPNVPILPPKPLSADVILKNILEVFKEAYRWLKDMDKGEIFASKVI